MKEKKSKKIILDLCGGTGSWSAPYKDAGYDVRLITLPKYNVLVTKFADDEIIFRKDHNDNYRWRTPKKDIYGILVAPPCTMFSFARTKAKKPRDLKEGFEVVRACLDIIWSCMEIQQDTKKKTLPLKFWALENPKGLLRRFMGKPAMEFNPYDFGDEYQKHTDLWGYFNEPIKKLVKLSLEQKKLHKTNSQPLAKYMKFDRLKTQERRAITPRGFADAFFRANQ